MAVFADYADLRVAVMDHVKDPSVMDVMDRLTKMAESDLSRELKTREQITSATVTIASGTAALPSDFVEVIGLFDAIGYEYIQASIPSVQHNDTRTFYAISGTDIEAQGPDGDRTLKYYAALPTITTSATTTNWLLARFPKVYLYGVAAEAFTFLEDETKAARALGLRNAAIEDARRADGRARYSRARVRVGGVTP